MECKTYEDFKKRLAAIFDLIIDAWQVGDGMKADLFSEEASTMSEQYPEWRVRFDDEMMGSWDKKCEKLKMKKKS